MANDPITLIVALDKNQKAKGHLYIDDGKSFNYKTKEEFVLIEFDTKKEWNFCNSLLMAPAAWSCV